VSTPFSESIVEEAALAWFGELGYSVVAGPQIAPGEPAAERASYEQVVLEGRLREALARLNPEVPGDALDEAYRKLTRIHSPQLIDANVCTRADPSGCHGPRIRIVGAWNNEIRSPDDVSAWRKNASCYGPGDRAG
jgi:hypothetical protein